jgi:hypothetical protein
MSCGLPEEACFAMKRNEEGRGGLQKSAKVVSRGRRKPSVPLFLKDSACEYSGISKYRQYDDFLTYALRVIIYIPTDFD